MSGTELLGGAGLVELTIFAFISANMLLAGSYLIQRAVMRLRSAEK